MKAPPEKRKPAVGAAGIRHMKTYKATIPTIGPRVNGVRHVSQILAEIFGRASNV